MYDYPQLILAKVVPGDEKGNERIGTLWMMGMVIE
jgi:hypothetical protein